MTKSSEYKEQRILAAAWLLSRTSDFKVDETIDLETLDQWRQGLLSPERSNQVKHQLANNPHLMSMLEELVEADHLLQEWDEEESKASIENNKIWQLPKLVIEKIVNHLRDPIWAGGLSALTAALVLAIMLWPVSSINKLNQELNNMYAKMDVPEKELTLSLGPMIVLRGGVDGKQVRLRAQQAFLAGMEEGFSQFKDRYPNHDIKNANRLNTVVPSCAEADKVCKKSVDLAHATGKLFFAVSIQCQSKSNVTDPKVQDILKILQNTWGDISIDNPLGNDIRGLKEEQNICGEVNQLIFSWSR